ncbi:MAG: dihydroneopterin aldolase [Candidatus Omnitrophica bacterium]|nr:dihydroneopterin aldolase [Candidatus Omnitrophota bacterium]
MAVIRINDLKVRTIIGAHSWERVNQQELVINITIEYDGSKPCRTDRLDDALNYEAVVARVINTVKRSRCNLLEKLAGRILAGIMSDLRVQGAYVRLDKPHAIPEARSVSFELSARS